MRRILTIDTETQLIRSDAPVPRLVCGGWYHSGSIPELPTTGTLPAVEFVRWIAAVLTDPSIVIVAHNAAFDWTVIIECANRIGVDLTYAVFAAYASDRIACTMIRESLISIAGLGYTPGYGLADCVKRYLGTDIGNSKKGEERTTFGPLESIPVSRWPDGHLSYLRLDCYYANAVYFAQAKRLENERREYWLKPEFDETRASFVFALISARGLRVDIDRQAAMRAYCQGAIERFTPELKTLGIIRSNGSENRLALRDYVGAAFRALNETIPTTPKGHISTDSKQLRRLLYVSGNDPRLHPLRTYMRFAKAKHTLSTYLSFDPTIHARFTTILKNGRTSSSPNVQNPPRFGLDCAVCDFPAAKRGGAAVTCPQCNAPVYDVRGNFCAAPGMVFLSGDYPAIEMRTWAEDQMILFGQSKAAEYINAGFDPHLLMAAQLLGLSYDTAKARFDQGDKEVRAKRTAGKPINFGRMGGLQWRGMIEYSLNYDVYMSESDSRMYCGAWDALYSDAPAYFRWVNSIPGIRGGHGELVHPISGFVRGGCNFTAGANFIFSHHAQLIGKALLWQVAVEQFCQPSSPLYGSRTVDWIHDEIIIEAPDDPTARTAAAGRLRYLMQASAERFIRSVKTPAIEIVAARRWVKDVAPKWSGDILEIAGD